MSISCMEFHFEFTINSFANVIHNLTHTPRGVIRDTRGFESCLAKCWECFDGGTNHGMAGYKLLGRMELVTWNPPILQFAVERHKTVGSVEAELQYWSVDLLAMTSSLVKTEGRTLVAVGREKSMASLAADIANLILSRSEDPHLHWHDERSVHVLATWVSPRYSLFSHTLGIRRKNLCQLVANELRPDGWENVGGYRFLFEPQGRLLA
jgi:hypothetical protein